MSLCRTTFVSSLEAGSIRWNWVPDRMGGYDDNTPGQGETFLGRARTAPERDMSRAQTRRFFR